MAATVLAEAGFRDMNFGPDTPLELLATAAEDKKPRIVWLAVKAVADRAKRRTKINELARKTRYPGNQSCDWRHRGRVTGNSLVKKNSDHGEYE